MKNSLGPQPHGSDKCQCPIRIKNHLPPQGFRPYEADDYSYGLRCVLSCHPVLFESGVRRVAYLKSKLDSM